MNAYGRPIVEEHLDACLEAGLNVEGINAEVATGQWEFQIFAKGAKEAGDQMWVARYLLERIGEKYGVSINWHCKPLGNLDWNGSGMHANFSNSLLRNCGSRTVYEQVCEAFRPVISEHIDVYGPDNHRRFRQGRFHSHSYRNGGERLERMAGRQKTKQRRRSLQSSRTNCKNSKIS
jgi:glutamine synthetase